MAEPSRESGEVAPKKDEVAANKVEEVAPGIEEVASEEAEDLAESVEETEKQEGPEAALEDLASDSHEGSDTEQKPAHVLLNERFKREEINFPHGRLEIRDVIPENPRDSIPLVSTLGFGTGNIALERTVSELYDSGEHVVELDFIGGGKGVKGEKGSSSEYNRQGMLLADFMDKYFSDNPHLEQMDIMSQSAGLFRVLAMAELRPDLIPKIRNLVLTAPFGLNEDDSLLGIARRQRAEDKRYKNAPRGEFDEDNDRNLQIAFKKTVLPYLGKAAKEIWAMAKADQYPKLEKLREKGVKIGVIQGDEDELAPVDKLMERVGKDSESPFRILTREEYEAEPRYRENGITYEQAKHKWNEGVKNETPPIDVIREVKGGHGVQVDDPKKAAKMILGTIDSLNSPPGRKELPAVEDKPQE